MLWPAHFGASYLGSLAAIELSRERGVVERSTGAVVAYGIAAGLISDVDALPLILQSGLSAFGDQFGVHRLSPFHTPVFAAAMCLLPLLLPIPNRRAWSLAGLIGVVSHLALDSLTIGPGVMWLYPFSRQLYGIDLATRWYPFEGRDSWMIEYIVSPLFLIEVAIVIVAATVWLRRRRGVMRAFSSLLCLGFLLVATTTVKAQGTPTVPTPSGIAPGSITSEDVPYPHPVSYLSLTLYGQDVRMAFMDVPALGPANGATVVLLHGNNFAGFYFGGPIEALRKEGFRVVVPDQIGYGRSSKPIIPYNLHDMARNTRLLLQSLKIERAMIVGHSMGGMLAARFATQYPAMTERLVLYNPIGLTDPRFDRPWESTDEAYRRTLGSTYQTIRAALLRYVSHNPAAWTPELEQYTRIRYSWTLSADWPRLAMVQAMLGQVQYLDPVINDWEHITAPTLVFGGAEDSLPGSAAVFQQRMKFVAERIPNGRGRLHLIPGIGHVPHLEAPEKTYPPLIAFLKEASGSP